MEAPGWASPGTLGGEGAVHQTQNLVPGRTLRQLRGRGPARVCVGLAGCTGGAEGRPFTCPASSLNQSLRAGAAGERARAGLGMTAAGRGRAQHTAVWAPCDPPVSELGSLGQGCSARGTQRTAVSHRPRHKGHRTGAYVTTKTWRTEGGGRREETAGGQSELEPARGPRLQSGSQVSERSGCYSPAAEKINTRK